MGCLTTLKGCPTRTKKVGKKRVLRDRSEWVKIQCTPLVSNELFEAAQDIRKLNREYRRKMPRRFYMLSGMVFCRDCDKPYVASTANSGTGKPYNYTRGYRHRIKNGHCSNKWQNAEALESLVWDKVANILLDPKSLREGYKQTIELEQQKQARQIQYMESLQAGIEKLKAKKARLQQIYLDPDIGMTKEEYLEEKRALDAQLEDASTEVEKLTGELQKIPSEADLENLEQIASKIVAALGENLDISPQDKREIMKMLNLKVLISRKGGIKLEGWFTPESDGLSSNSIR